MPFANQLARLRSRRGLALVVAVVVAVGVIAGLVTANSGDGVRVRSELIAGTPEGRSPVTLDTSLYLPSTTPAPAILLAQGFGGDKTGLEAEARTFAGHGYVVLAYSARGFGQSGGDIHFDNPNYEIKDAQRLIDWLARRPEVAERNGDPQVAVAGSSYGGGLALLLAATDRRIDAVAADITWNNLTTALFPNAAGTGAGVFKKLWVGELFGNAFTDDPSDVGDVGRRGSVSCGRFAPDVCAAYQASAQRGRPTPALQRLLDAASPSRVLGRITAPTLLIQGEQDSLFPLTEADANARGIAANGTPVKVVWRSGGHDDFNAGGDIVPSETLSWFDAVFSGDVSKAQPFRFVETGGTLSSDNGGELRSKALVAAGYPGLDGIAPRTRRLSLQGPAQTVSAPADGVPAAVSTVPGLGGILGSLGSASALSSGLSVVPSQTAFFASPELAQSVLVAGSPTVRLTLTSRTATDATLFVALRDVTGNDPTSAALPSRLVAPLRLTGLTPGHPTTVTVHLPAIVRSFGAGHRVVLTVATTDFGYQLPQDARDYTIGLASPTLTVPTIVGATVIAGGHPLAWLIVGAVTVVLALAFVMFVLRRRRRVVKPRPELKEVPVAITSLVKEYRGGYRAVDDITFSVERGQVVGLLGPNGAGKTTTLRVLVGLITPTSGTVHVFGEPITPGAAVLARLGAFIEGPGFLPHLSGRDNLRLYWQATGRPEDEADFETALEIAGLGSSIDRKVRAYSHGMRQRLGIAQAMLGLPELLVLDEPTNGLDPPQIAEMREVLQRYARTGRTVVISSHLLAEVEQTCTHVVVMHKGRLVAAGSVVDIAGAGRTQLAVDDPSEAAAVLAGAGISATLVPARRALEDVFLDLVGADE